MYKKSTFLFIHISLLCKFSLSMPFVVNNTIEINKCCEKFEILQDLSCVISNNNDTGQFKPPLMENNDIKYSLSIGDPTCGSNQIWHVFDYLGSVDKLVLLEDGKLRHYTYSSYESISDNFSTTDDYEKKSRHYDYVQGQYCIDKGILNNGTTAEYIFAKVCSPHSTPKWADCDFIVKRILRPIFDIITIIIFLIIAIVYFVLPTLRDLVGNIITTISMCLVFSQGANFVKDLHLTNHINYLILDAIIYICLLSAFIWLTSLGYYIWKKFHSKNIFLRVTDGQKYCWYSSYVWGITLLISSLALFAHFFLDIAIEKNHEQNTITIESNQETIGRLAIGIFFSPIALNILIDICFQLNTFKLIYKRNVYGRIQQKLKSNFIMFSSLSLMMTLDWMFLILSWFNKGLVSFYIFFNALQAPIIFYICILQQKHVTFLLRKAFCYNEPTAAHDWGDELTHINDGNF